MDPIYIFLFFYINLNCLNKNKQVLKPVQTKATKCRIFFSYSRVDKRSVLWRHVEIQITIKVNICQRTVTNF